MTLKDKIHAYFDAWNDRDGSKVRETFAPRGTYHDSATGGPISGDGIAAMVDMLVASFPDLRFEPDELLGEGGRWSAQWRMKGTQTGPGMGGTPPSGKSIDVPGSDFFQVSEQGIESVRGYFDMKDFVEQVGMQALVMPTAIGPWTFGDSARVTSATKGEPGVLSMTYITFRDEADKEAIRQRTLAVMEKVSDHPAFLGFMAAAQGDRGYTVAAWADEVGMKEALRASGHDEYVKEFFRSDVGQGGVTTVWKPIRLNAFMVPCPGCGVKTRPQRQINPKKCEKCGAKLPVLPGYF